MRTKLQVIGALRDWMRRHYVATATLLIAALKVLAVPIPAHALEPGVGLQLNGDRIDLQTPVAKDYGGLGVDATNVPPNTFFAGPASGGNGEGGFRTIVDADIPNDITVDNYLPLAGGTLTGPLTLSSEGVAFTASDDNPVCGVGTYSIYADNSEGKLKKCQDGQVSDLDTAGEGASSSVSLQGFCTTTSIDLDVSGTDVVFVSPFSGSWFTAEDKATVPFDAGTVSDFRCKGSATLGANVTAELAKGACGTPIAFDCQAGDLCVTVTSASSTAADSSTLAIEDGECAVVRLSTAQDPVASTYCCSWTYTR